MPAAEGGGISFDAPFHIQIAQARALAPMLAEAFYGLTPEKRALAFTVSGLARLDQVQAVADSLIRAEEQGWSFSRWKAWAETQEWTLPRHRLETIFRTNLQTNYMAGHWRNFELARRSRPWLMFDAINDSRVRPNHLALDGVIRAVDDPVWDRISPPLGFNCRCTLRSLSDRAARRRGGRTQVVPAEGRADGDGWGRRPAGQRRELAAAAARRMEQAPVLAGDSSAMRRFRALLSGADAGMVTPEILREAIGDAVWDAAVEALAARDLPPEFRDLTEVERVALHIWTRDVARDAWFRRINAFLRASEAPTDAALLPLIVAMRSGLAKLPPARRPLLFRAEKVGRKGIETYLKRFPEGNAISPGGFMATTPHHDRILKGSVTIVVDGNAGRWIGPLSAYPEQDEVLFDPAAAFMVDQVMRTKHGAVVWLRQL